MEIGSSEEEVLQKIEAMKATKMRQKMIKEIKVPVWKRRKKFQISRWKRFRLPLIDSKKEKAEDSNGIRAEDIKACDKETKEMMRQIFNEVLKQRECTPEAWRRQIIKVIYKKGDVEEAGNYRPTCTLPALYKLFSTLMYNRLYPRLDRGQPDDQGGFRRTFRTLDRSNC